MTGMNPRTKQNLNAAMQYEFLTCAKYLRFAAAAKLQNAPSVARVFQDAAEADRCRSFAAEAECARLVSSCADNLKQAITDKKYQIALYDRFAWESAWDGDKPAAAMFEALKADETAALEKFERALAETQSVSSQPGNPQEIAAA